MNVQREPFARARNIHRTRRSAEHEQPAVPMPISITNMSGPWDSPARPSAPASEPFAPESPQEDPSPHTVNRYSWFAEVYDVFGSEDFCLSMTEYLVEAADRYGIEPGSRCLDVACGTGVITVELARAGFEMTGLDRSRQMLAYAKLRAREADQNIPFIEQDMRYFSVSEPFPWIICTHDSLDHLIEEVHLNMAFQQISEALSPGGWFMFDMNCWEGIRHLNGKTVFVEAEDRAAAYYLESKDNRLKTSIVIFIRKPDSDLYQRFDETLYQRCYSDEQVMAALDRYGLSVREKVAVQHLKGHTFKQLWICQSTRLPVPDVL